MTRRTWSPSDAFRDDWSPSNRVTVVMATYNGSTYLPAQLASLEQQTLPPARLIVSDDGSTDDTVAIVESFAARAPFPVSLVINEHNLGYAQNFLNACRLVTTELVALCDQDDVWDPRKLEVSQRELISSGASLVVHPVHLIDPSGQRVGHFSQGIGRRRFVAPLTSRPWGVYYGFTMTFRRDLLDLIPSASRGAHTFEHQGQLSHDLWIFFLATSLRTTLEIPDRLAAYRQHASNQTPHLVGRSLQRLTSSLGKAVDPGVPRNRIARHRGHVLADAARVAPAAEAATFEAARAFWTTIAAHEDRRLAVYGARRGTLRLLHWIALVTRGGYGPHRGAGLGWRLGVKDLVAGVIGVRRAENRSRV